MNLPNKLTILRVILIPFFVFFLISPFFDGYGNYIALAIFIIASLILTAVLLMCRLESQTMELSLQQATGENLRQPSRCLWLLLLFLISICSLAG